MAPETATSPAPTQSTAAPAAPTQGPAAPDAPTQGPTTQGPAAPISGAPPAAPLLVPSPAAGAPLRRDPNGVTGVSPFWEELGKGDQAVVAGDLPRALAAYRVAIGKSPQNALGYYRLGQTQTLSGSLADAEQTYAVALRYVGPDSTLKAKLLFCMADLSERQAAHDVALSRWSEYEAHANADPRAKTYPATARERRTRLETIKKLLADAAAAKLKEQNSPRRPRK
ncbi:MAG TPA: hypothetical protein VER33_19600 [Polyangiaceae bacterium]|nr:hypothetical protein [Polyangiaceae bacterium]